MKIGLTGTKGSGKGEVAEILKQKGFVYSSLSDRVREEAVKRGMKNYNVTDLQDIGNELREKLGNGVLAKKTLELLKNKENAVIDGIRNIGEIEILKKQGFVIIAIDAPLKDRYERLVERGRESDARTWETFLKMNKRDLGGEEKDTGQQARKCMELADFRIINQGSLEELKKKFEEIFEKLK